MHNNFRLNSSSPQSISQEQKKAIINAQIKLDALCELMFAGYSSKLNMSAVYVLLHPIRDELNAVTDQITDL